MAPVTTNASVGANTAAGDENSRENLDTPSTGDSAVDPAGKTVLVIDGSSTVFPILEAAALELYTASPDLEVHLGVSGTGGGLKKFCRGETQIVAASRKMTAGEREQCLDAGIRPIRLPIAHDGISVVVHPENTWARCLDLETLGRLWRKSEEIPRFWSELDPAWPASQIRLHSPGHESGTADAFSEAIFSEGDLRSDVLVSEDDYLLAQHVASEPRAIAFFGYSYYLEHRDRLRLVAVDAGAGCVLPDESTISENLYRPLSRLLALYIDQEALQDPAVDKFLSYFFSNAADLVREVGAIPLSDREYSDSLRQIESAFVIAGEG